MLCNLLILPKQSSDSLVYLLGELGGNRSFAAIGACVRFGGDLELSVGRAAKPQQSPLGSGDFLVHRLLRLN